MTDPATEGLARLTATRTAREVSDLARHIVGDTSTPMSPEERITAARRLRVLVTELVDVTVLAEALAGAGWEELTTAAGRSDPVTVEAEYEGAVAEWKAAAAPPVEDVAHEAAALDEWYARHREDVDPDVQNPTSALWPQRCPNSPATLE